MTPRIAFVAGSSSLIGSETVAFLGARGWKVHGVDDNMRRDVYREPTTIHSDGSQTRDLIHVDDVIDAWLAVLDEPRTQGLALNDGNGRETSLRGLADTVVEACAPGGTWDVRTAPAELGDLRRWSADAPLVHELTGWAPRIGLKRDPARTVAWASEAQ